MANSKSYLLAQRSWLRRRRARHANAVALPIPLYLFDPARRRKSDCWLQSTGATEVLFDQSFVPAQQRNPSLLACRSTTAHR
jgi:hypothetical protein